jgi:hypothetical protein
VDKIATREVGYDTQAEDVRDQALLLNVLRAVNRKPMQFIDVGPVTGTTTTTAGLSLAAPLWFGGYHANAAGTGTPTGTISGGPSFVLTPLVSQEFYKGILQPVKSTDLARLIDESYPKQEILLLAIERITYTWDTTKLATDGKLHHYTEVFTNHFGRFEVNGQDHRGDPDHSVSCQEQTPKEQNQICYALEAIKFRHELQRLIDFGFTIEPTSSIAALSPPILPSAAKGRELPTMDDLRKITSIPSGASLKLYQRPADEKIWTIGKSDDKNISKDEVSALNASKARSYFRVESSETSAKFCFHPNSTEEILNNGDLSLMPISIMDEYGNRVPPTPPISAGPGTINFPVNAENDQNPENVKKNQNKKYQYYAADLRGLFCDGVADRTSSKFDDGKPKSEGVNKARAKISRSDGLYQLTLEIPPQAARKGTEGTSPAEKFTISVAVRSVEQMIYYLGEIARGDLMNKALKGDHDSGIYLPTFDWGDEKEPKTLFSIHSETAIGGPSRKVLPQGKSTRVEASYDNMHYWVDIDAAGQDLSTSVMEIITQLTALNNSAKDLPPSGTVTLISH